MDKPDDKISQSVARDQKRHDRARITRWLEKERGKPQFRAAPKASSAVNKIIRPLAKKAGGSTAPLREAWPQIIGSKLAKVSRPLRYGSGMKGKTLIIEAPSAAIAIISSNAPKILERIEAHIGPHNIAHIKVIASRNKTHDAPIKAYQAKARGLSPSEKDRLERSLSELKNEALRKPLSKLGHSLFIQDDRKSD